MSSVPSRTEPGAGSGAGREVLRIIVRTGLVFLLLLAVLLLWRGSTIFLYEGF